MRSTEKVKILIVDDLEENLVALEALLRSDDLEILQARSAAEALELLLVHPVALALLDVQMPETDGFELAELMRGTERTKQVPIIFLTAGSHDAQRVFRGYEVGAVDFLFKPIDPILLGHKVSTFVNLHRQRLELAAMLRFNEMFMAAVTHDLRTPLSSMIMGTSLLRPALAEPKALQTLDRMRASADRMAHMLTQLNDLARARLGAGLVAEPREIDARALVERVVEELRGAWPERALNVTHRGVDASGFWDEHRLAQVLANLVGNAFRHGAADGAVNVRVEVTDTHLLLDVQNEGTIPEPLLPLLFEPFRQGQGSRKREGLGLGLYIVQAAVVGHGGTVEVTSDATTGTTFHVRLPRRTEA